MIKVDQVVSWKHRGRRHKGVVCAIVHPGENAFEKYPYLQFTPGARARFQERSDSTRVIIEEPRDGRGGKHYSRFYAPLLSVVERNLKGGEQIGNQA